MASAVETHAITVLARHQNIDVRLAKTL
jgi:hypothetical protein